MRKIDKTEHYVRYTYDDGWAKRAFAYYSLPWWRRIFRKPPK